MIDTTTGLPHTRFDTTACPPERRLNAWRESIGVLFEVHPDSPEAAHAPIILDNWQLGPAVLTAGTGPSFSYDRTPQAIARDGRDLYLVQFYAVGRCSITRGAPAVDSEPGDLVVTDLTRAMTTRETAFRNINLLLPRSSLAPLLRAPDGHGGRVLRRDLPLVALARAHVSELARQAPRLSAAQAADTLGATMQLLAAALNGGADEETERGVQVALTCRIRRYIKEHLCGHDLSPEALAARFGSSRATLYRLFADEGGIRQFIQRRRLAHARFLLMSSAHRHKTMATIGTEVGYARAQDFIRAYRREFGVTPGEEREQSRRSGRMRLGRRAPDLPLWAEWVSHIGP